MDRQPMLLGFFMNAAIDQECELYIKENGLEDEVSKKIDKIFMIKRSRTSKVPG